MCLHTSKSDIRLRLTSYIGMRLGNLRGFDSLYRIRTGTFVDSL